MKTETSHCDLCGLSLRFGRVTSNVGDRIYHFCCAGCRQVFSILSEAADAQDVASFKESDLFKQCQSLGIIPRSENELRDEFEKNHSTQTPHPQTGTIDTGTVPSPALQDFRDDDSVIELNLQVGGMWCPACAWVIDEILKKDPGVVDSSCNFSTDRLHCRYNAVLTTPAQIMATISKLGYQAALPGDLSAESEQRRETIRFGITAFLTMNIMMLSFALYSGFFSDLTPDGIFKLSWPIFGMTCVVLGYGGRHIFRRALAGITTASASMETLIAVGSSSAFLFSCYNLLHGSLHLYFDTASMLITLVLLGKLLERGAKRQIQANLETLFSIQPTKVKISDPVAPGGRYVTVAHLQAGDIFLLDEGEIAPADGTIIEGEGFVDAASLTGETVAVRHKPGELIRSGIRVIEGHFKIRAQAVGSESTLGQMIRIMEHALRQRTPLEGKTDRMLRWFVPVILVLSGVTGVVGHILGLSLEQTIIRAVTVTVIACPCALGVAIPLTRVAAIAVASRIGLLIRDFKAIESAGRVDTFVFDKTGTLTRGRWILQDIQTFGAMTPEQALELALGLEVDTEHTIAIEMKRYAASAGVSPADITDVKDHGNGRSGKLGRDRIYIGAKALVAAMNDTSTEFPEIDPTHDSTNASLVYLGFQGRLAAVFVFGDRLRSGAADTVAALQSSGHRLILVSGDGIPATRSVAQALSISESHGELLPQDKAAIIEELKRQGHHVAMVGDGVNDAPALTLAHLAVAMHAGSHLGKEVADVTLMRGEPEQLLDFFDLSQKTQRKVSQNLFGAFIYNTISIPVAVSGLLSPLVAVCAMLLSSLTVILNTLRLVKGYTPPSIQ